MNNDLNPQYEFRIVEEYDGYIVQVQTTNYNYGEDYGDYGWDNVINHPILKRYFHPSYASLSTAVADVRSYRGQDNVVWSEREEIQKSTSSTYKTQKDRYNEL